MLRHNYSVGTFESNLFGRADLPNSPRYCD